MKKIMIVDDQEEIRELVKITLSESEYAIHEASSGEEAVEIAEGEIFDLIIMDVMMPGKIDGIKATEMIKNNPKAKDCTILMLTSKGEQEDMDKGYKAGAAGYFIKPFSPLELLNKVEQILNPD